ncbi:DUF6141 family protein [Pontibacter sp. H259]|uniref:DUF6141 family protein n=1 Tax=Pontibacter sp. H259 TaxID=3133421 RepID=UPI0030BF80AC
MKVLFRERQRFRQVWLWVVILGVAAIFWAGFVYQVVLDGQFGNKPTSDIQLAIMLGLIGVGLPLFFYKMSLTTEVVSGELKVRFWPFHVKPVLINLHELREYKQVTYNPIMDYGGWGIRWTFHGTAYNVYGNEGVKLYFYNRKPLLIGSQKPEELVNAITIAKQKI